MIRALGAFFRLNGYDRSSGSFQRASHYGKWRTKRRTKLANETSFTPFWYIQPADNEDYCTVFRLLFPVNNVCLRNIEPISFYSS